MPSSPDAAQNAVATIVKACSKLRNSLRTAHPNFANLLFEFNRHTGSAISEIENYGTDIHFASATESFIAAANSWNKRVYSRLRDGNGEIRHGNGSNKSNVNVVLYAGEFTQEFDAFEQIMSFFESSPLRSLQSMQYVLEYYQALLTELQNSLSYLPSGVGFYNTRQIYAKRLDELRYKSRQLEFGFESDGAAWEKQRSLSDAALRWRQEEERIALERELERRRTERIQEQQRLQAKQAKKEEARRAREERQRQKLEERRLRALEETRERKLQEAKMENAKLRRKIRIESQQSGLLLEYEGWRSSSDSVTASAVEPWAIFYEDDQIDNFLSEMFEKS